MDILFYALLIPLLGALVVYLVPAGVINIVHIAFSAATSFVLLKLVFIASSGEILYALDSNLFLDPLGAVFLFIIAVSGFFINLYFPTYIKWQYLSVIKKKVLLSLAHITVFAMILASISNNLILMWAAIEATTIATLFMVTYKDDKKIIEAGYKYIMVCSIGLSLAMFATILLYSSAFHTFGDVKELIFFSFLQNTRDLDPTLSKIVFIFALIGFGTKAGLAPTHTWLPDAHASGPAPTSAMLSGIVLKVAMLGLIRYYIIVLNNAGPAFVEQTMLISGLFTTFLAGIFLIRQHDIKRMFAYHSVVHMGVVAFGLGVGGKLGVFAAIFHCLAHSLTKALAFLVTGNTGRIYGTNDMTKMGGMIKIAPVTTVLLGIAICSLVGVPAFSIFVSEFMMFKASIMDAQYLIAILFAIALLIIFIADFSHFFLAGFNEPRGKVHYNGEMSFYENLPVIAFGILVIAFGVWKFEFFWGLIGASVDMIRGLQ